MTEVTRIAIDTSKHVFTLHGVDAAGKAVLKRNLRRSQMEAFFAAQPACEVAMEACGGAHHWARLLQRLGHRARLIPPQYVTPFVKRGKNDRKDAAAISEASVRPEISFVAVKSAAQQAAALVLSLRELLVRQRTQLSNALRGHAAEFGLVSAQGAAGLQKLLQALAEDATLPVTAKTALEWLGGQITRLDGEIATIDARLLAQHKEDAMSRLLEGIPGVGPLTAQSLVLRVDARQFASGRHFAAWLGLTPRDHSTGGKQRLGKISRAGDERLRQLLVLGATAVIRHTRAGRPGVSAWLLGLLGRKPRKLVAVALANKMARIVWAMMTRGEAYRRAPVAA